MASAGIGEEDWPTKHRDKEKKKKTKLLTHPSCNQGIIMIDAGVLVRHHRKEIGRRCQVKSEADSVIDQFLINGQSTHGDGPPVRAAPHQHPLTNMVLAMMVAVEIESRHDVSKQVVVIRQVVAMSSKNSSGTNRYVFAAVL